MDRKNKLAIKYATRNNSKADYLHSSAYGKVQSGDHIGAAGRGETFRERQKRAREFVGRYDDAAIARQGIHKLDPGTKTFDAAADKQSVGAQRWEAIQEATQARKAKNAPDPPQK